MKKLINLTALVLISINLIGCAAGSSGIQKVAPTPPPANSFNSKVETNPNLPPAAKKALLGNTAGHP